MNPVSRNVYSVGWTRRDLAATFQAMTRERWEQVGETVRTLREELGFSQEELAHRAGLSAKTISRIESPPASGAHEVRGSTFRKLAGALGVQVSDLRAPLQPATVSLGAVAVEVENTSRTVDRAARRGGRSQSKG